MKREGIGEHGDLSGELTELAVHLGQAGNHLEVPPLFTHGDRWRTQDLLTVWHVTMDTRLGADDHVLADSGIIFDPRLAGHDHVIAGLAAPGDADLTTEQIVTADLV